MTSITRGQVWTYHGPDAPWLQHTVVEVSADGVVTWSEPVKDNTLMDQGVAGYSWMGSTAEFLANFTQRAAPIS